MLISHLTCCHFQQTSHMLPLPADLSHAATSGRLLALPLTADFTSSCTFPGTLSAVSYPCIATPCACMHLHSCGLDNMDPTNVQDHTKLICIFGITPGMRTHNYSYSFNWMYLNTPRMKLHIQSHSWNYGTVRHFLARTDLTAVIHNHIIVFLLHLHCMGHH